MNMDQQSTPKDQLQTINMDQSSHPADLLHAVNMDQPSHPADQLQAMNMDQPSHPADQLHAVNMDQQSTQKDQLHAVNMDQPSHPADQLQAMNMDQPSHPADQLHAVDMDQQSTPKDQLHAVNMDQPSHPDDQLQAMNMDQPSHPRNQRQTPKEHSDIVKIKKGEENTHVSDMKIRTPGDKYVSFREQAVKDCDEYYPDCDKKTYRVPPMTMKSKRVIKKPGDEYSVIKDRNAENDKGKDLELDVCNSLVDLKYIHGKEEPMFVISNYEFENYLKEIKTKHFPGADFLPLQAGEHDILLLHLQHGAVFIQVKAVEECKSEADKKQRDNRNKMIRKRLIEGLRQLDRDVEVFHHIMKDLDLNIPVTKVLALANISKKYISTLTTSMELLKDKLGKNALDICLFRDQININTNYENEGKELLLEWWKRNISMKHGFRDADEYKQVIGRYVGLMSTVKMRTFGDVIAEEGYQNMRIILTPEQVKILRSNERKLYIQGSFGTGKTILLILKARQMVREGESVLMVCGRSTKQLTHLVACVKADMTEEQKTLVHYITDYKTLHSLDSSEQYNIFVDECYIFALSYIVNYCGKNNKLCWLAGRCVPDVKEFSVKQLTKELRSPETVASVCDKLDEDFLYDVVKSGDFPVIDHLSHRKCEDKMSHANESMFNGSTIWRCQQCWTDIIDEFVQMKLIKVNCGRLDSQAVPIPGSDPCGQTEEASTEATCANIPDNTLTNELKDLIEPHNPLARSDIAILLPHYSFITNMDIEAIDQISDKYGIPFNYCLLRDNETVQNKADAKGCRESGDEDILLGNTNEVIICASSQFLGLERKVAGWENITTDVEMSDCQAWISLLDLANILTVYNSPKGMTVNTLDAFSNQAKFHLLCEILKKHPIFSQGILLLADTYLADCNNKCHFNDIAQTFFLKLIKITDCMDNFETSLDKFKKDLDKFFSEMEKAFKSRFSRYSDQFDEATSWNVFLRLISVLTKKPVVVNDKGTTQITERDLETSHTTEGYAETSQTIKGGVKTLRRSRENTNMPEKTEGDVKLLQTIDGNVKTPQATEGDVNISQTIDGDVNTSQTTESDLLNEVETFVLEIFVPKMKSLLTVDDSDDSCGSEELIPPNSESNPIEQMVTKMSQLFLSNSLTKISGDSPSTTDSTPRESCLNTDVPPTSDNELSDILKQVQDYFPEIMSAVQGISSDGNMQEASEATQSNESSQSMDLTGFPGTSTSKLHSITSENPASKSSFSTEECRKLAISALQSSTPVHEVSKQLDPNEPAETTSVSSSTTDSKTTAECLDADSPRVSDTQPETLDCFKLAKGSLPDIMSILQNIRSGENMQEACKPDETVWSSESSQLMDSIELPSTSVSNIDSIAVKKPPSKSPFLTEECLKQAIPQVMSVLPGIIESEEMKKAYKLYEEKQLQPNESGETTSVSSSTTDSKTTAECLDADPPPASDTQPETLDCFKLAKGILPGVMSILQIISSGENMQEACKPDETVRSSESSQLRDSSGLPGTSVSNTDSIAVDNPAYKAPFSTEESLKQAIPEVMSVLPDINSSEEMKKAYKLYEEKQFQELIVLQTASKESVTTDTTAIESPDSAVNQCQDKLQPIDLVLTGSNIVDEELRLSKSNESIESLDFTDLSVGSSSTTDSNTTIASEANMPTILKLPLDNDSLDTIPQLSVSSEPNKSPDFIVNESEETAQSSESPEPNDLTETSGSSSLNTDSKQTDNCLGIESLSAKLKDMSEQFFTALRLALQTHISINCNLHIKDVSGKELVNDFEQSERSNEAKQSNESSCSYESTRSDKSTLPNESSRLDESTPSNDSTMSKEVTPLDESIPSKASTQPKESTRSDESIHSKEETSLNKPVHSGSNGGTQTNETYLSIDLTLLDFPMPSTTNDMVQLFFSALESQDETKLGFPLSIIKHMLKQSTRSKEATQSDASSQSDESTQLDESTQSKESTQSNESSQLSSKRDSQTSTIPEITPDPTVETNVPSNFKLKIKENGLVIDLPWSDMPTNVQNEEAKIFFKCFGSFDLKLNVKDLHEFALSRQSNELTGEAMKSFLNSYTRLRDSFSSTGLLKNISTWFVKMVFLYSAISRSTSRVFIWRKK